MNIIQHFIVLSMFFTATGTIIFVIEQCIGTLTHILYIYIYLSLLMIDMHVQIRICIDMHESHIVSRHSHLYDKIPL